VAVFVTRFWWFAELSGFDGTPFGAFELAVLVRAMILVACVVAWVRRREPAPIAATPSENALAGVAT
jgi:hypothetical protein